MNKKVGIVTVYGENNYGNKLQNYASVKLYENFGYNVNTIKVLQSRMLPTGKEKIKKNLKKIVGVIPKYKYLKYQSVRENNFINFSNEYLKITKNFNTSNISYDFLENYDYLSIGSDQVWNDTDFNEHDVHYYLLDAINKSQIITLSPSFGKVDIKENNIDIFKRNLLKYKSLSCREKSGANLIKSMVGRECEVLVDPTMALSREDWIKIEKRPNWLTDEKYALCYFLGGIDKYQLSIIDKCKKNEMKLIDVLDKKDIAYTTSPEEFLYLINHANIIFTDSFHACVFSIIFKRNFVVYHRANQESEMESRITNLLSIFGVNSVEYGREYSCEYLKNTDEVLRVKRDELLAYLKHSLES